MPQSLAVRDSRPEILAAARRIYVSRAQRGKPSREKVLSGLPPRQSSPAESVRLRCGSRLEIRASSLICTAGAFILPSLARMAPARHDSFPREESPSSLANDGTKVLMVQSSRTRSGWR